jgi:hypothetical protein
LKLGLKRRNMTDRLTQSLVVRHLKESCVVVRLFDTLLERVRMIDKLNCCAHFLLSPDYLCFVLIFLFIVDWVTLSSHGRGGPLKLANWLGSTSLYCTGTGHFSSEQNNTANETDGEP